MPDDLVEQVILFVVGQVNIFAAGVSVALGGNHVVFRIGSLVIVRGSNTMFGISFPLGRLYGSVVCLFHKFYALNCLLLGARFVCINYVVCLDSLEILLLL